MKPRERTCSRCGEVTITCSKALRCNRCRADDKAAQLITENRQLLERIYDHVEGPTLNVHNQRQWTFVHRDCSVKQTWTFTNILKQLKLRPDRVPCSHCGSKERIKPAMDAYVEKYGMTEEKLKEWKKYQRKVRGLSDVVFEQHKAALDPHNYGRTKDGRHLDHKKSIIQCFEDGDPPEFAARVENLQMLKAFDNLSKGRKCH